jgi:hypothetical protein
MGLDKHRKRMKICEMRIRILSLSFFDSMCLASLDKLICKETN